MTLDFSTSKNPFGTATGNDQGKYRFDIRREEVANGEKTGIRLHHQILELAYNQPLPQLLKSEFGINFHSGSVGFFWNFQMNYNIFMKEFIIEIYPYYSHNGTIWSLPGSLITIQ